jgi:hypothetical protein
MSESMSMLDDNLYINNINPFWEEPPGARSKPYLFNPSVKNTIEQEPDEIDRLSMPREGVEQLCPLSRPLYPRRYIDGEEIQVVPPSVSTGPEPMVQLSLDKTDMVVVGVVLIIILLLNNIE